MAEFINDNPETVIGLFGKRGYYKYSAFKDHSHINIVDFTTAEKYFYGRVDFFYVPIVPKNSRDSKAILGPFKNFNSELSHEGVKSAHSFVVDAFEDLATEFKKRVMSGQIDGSDPFLSNLRIYKAYQDPAMLYDDYLSDYVVATISQFKADKVRVENFDDFVQHLMVYLKNSLRAHPFTMPGYVKSRYCPITSTGLAIEIADLSASNDEEKAKQFWESKNWDFFANACSNYGFMVDQFVPWRLVADIGGPVMPSYSGQYGMSSLAGVLNHAFEPAHITGYIKFKNTLFRLYNQIKFKSFLKEEPCKNGGTTTKKVIPETYTKEQLSEKYPTEYFVELYCKIRFQEEESSFEEHTREILTDDCVELAQSAGLTKSLMVFERILNKTFDYRGSMSYINKHIQAVENDLSDD